MNPKRMVALSEGDVGAHSENIGIDGHREHHGGEDGEHLHGEIELV